MASMMMTMTGMRRRRGQAPGVLKVPTAAVNGGVRAVGATAVVVVVAAAAAVAVVAAEANPICARCSRVAGGGGKNLRTALLSVTSRSVAGGEC